MRYNWTLAGKKPKTKEVEQEQVVQQEQRIMSHDDDMLFPGSPTVEVQDNRIFFYGDVKDKEIMQLNKAIKRLESEVQFFRVKFDANPIVHLHINSNGGDVLSGFAAYDLIRKSKVEIHTHVEGVSASAATLLSLAGKKRYMTENSFMLLHELSTFINGKYDHIKDEYKNMTLFMERILNIYKSHVNLEDGKLEEILKHDWFLDSKTCLEYGLVDELD